GVFVFRRTFIKSVTFGLSIRMKLTALFLLSMFLPISLLVIAGLNFSIEHGKVLLSDSQQHLLRELKWLDEGAQEFYRNKLVKLRAIKDFPEIKNLNLSKVKIAFQKMHNEKKLHRAYLVDMAGNIVFDQDYLFNEIGRKAFVSELGKNILKIARTAASPSASETSEKDILGRDFISRIMNKRGEMNLISWPGSVDQVYLFLDLVRLSEKNEVSSQTLALIVGIDKKTLDEEYLTLILRALPRSSEVTFFAIDREDITRSIPELKPTFKANLLPLISIAQVQETPEPEKIKEGENHRLVMLNPGRIIDGYYVGAHLDWEQIMDSIHFIYFVVAFALFTSVVGALFLVFLLAKGFLTPVDVLSQGTKAIAEGNLSLVLPVYGQDELGELSMAFNNMTRRLKNRLNELTVLYELTQKASTTHNQREVFDIAANNLLRHLNARSCGIAWINEGDGLNNLYLSEAKDAEQSKQVQETVLKSLKKRAFHLDSMEGGKTHILAIPLFFEDKDFGGLYLLFSGSPPPLTMDERSFMETLRHHLSIIIEKQRLFEQAITDGLTRLYVRRFFLVNLEKELARSKRYKLDLSIILIDIDHFKHFNDSYGHQVGDMVLRETAQRIIESIRSADTPGRYGGEELSIILPQTNLKDALIVAERIKNNIAFSSYPHDGKSLKVTVSMGVTTLCGRDPTLNEF
ncbi:diguanylate cyclase, partial [bacterium]|nr:diguanylate cyclase [bacterium]